MGFKSRAILLSLSLGGIGADRTTPSLLVGVLQLVLLGGVPLVWAEVEVTGWVGDLFWLGGLLHYLGELPLVVLRVEACLAHCVELGTEGGAVGRLVGHSRFMGVGVLVPPALHEPVLV